MNRTAAYCTGPAGPCLSGIGPSWGTHRRCIPSSSLYAYSGRIMATVAALQLCASCPKSSTTETKLEDRRGNMLHLKCFIVRLPALHELLRDPELMHVRRRQLVVERRTAGGVGSLDEVMRRLHTDGLDIRRYRGSRRPISIRSGQTCPGKPKLDSSIGRMHATLQGCFLPSLWTRMATLHEHTILSALHGENQRRSTGRDASQRLKDWPAGSSSCR